MADLEHSSQEVILDELTKLRATILQNLSRFGRNATGETGRSMHVVMKPDGGTLYGRKFFDTLEIGRGPTINPTPHHPTLFQRILAWMEAKGVYADDGNNISLAWAITKKIHKEGTLLFREHKNSGRIQDIYTSAVQRAIENISNRLLELAKTEVQTINLHFAEETKSL